MRRRLDELLDSVGLAAAASRRVRELSGGEQQRLASPAHWPADPSWSSSTSPPHRSTASMRPLLVEVLAGVASRGATMVIATHDPMVIEAGDVIAELDHGRRIR